jgi:hypothetical protein
MKKSIFLLFIFCLISFSNVWAGSFDEYFPIQTNMIVNLDMAECKSYLDVIKDSKLDETYNEVMLCLNKKLSIDLTKDLKEISICFLKVRMGFLNIENSVPFIFINGNFKSKDSWSSIIKSTALEITGQEVKNTNISINGEEKTVFTAGNIQFIFLNDSVLFIGVNGSSELLKKGEISFKKSPQHLTKVSEMAKSYLYFSKDLIWRIPVVSELFADTKTFDSVSIYIKDNKINIMTYVKDIRSIDEKINNLNDRIIKFKERYTKIFEEEKKWLKEAPLSEFIKISKIIYSDALFKKVIDNIKLSNSMNFIIVSLPLENYIKEHVFLFFINSMISDLYFKLNSGVFQACSANISQLTRALEAYKEMDNSDLYHSSSIFNKKDDDEYYTTRRLKEKVTKPNPSGRSMMILDTKTLLDNNCLEVEPLKPDPDCEYVLYREYELDRVNVLCMKHSFMQRFRHSFGDIFRDGYMPYAFKINQTKKEVIEARNCYYYQKEISDSVEKYNKSHDKKMSKLDINALIESGCLKKSVSDSKTNCEYYSEGDLTTDEACISCIIHGPESYKIDLEDKIGKKWKIRQINFSKVDCDTVSENDFKEIENCSFSIRMYTGGIYRYNQTKDSEKITTDLNDSVISELINKKFIWERDNKDNPECKYYIEGDFTNNGQVACKKHGYLRNKNH